MSPAPDRIRKRILALEHVQAPMQLGVLMVPSYMSRQDWDRWIQEHAPGRPVVVIPEKRWLA